MYGMRGSTLTRGVAWAALLAAPAALCSPAAGVPHVASHPPRAATFVERGTPPGRYGRYSPWSPTTAQFAYADGSGILVLNLESTTAQPVRVVNAVDTDCTWSPDGTWLLVRTPSIARDAEGAALVVVPARGGGAATSVADGVLLSDFVWAGDGKIYYWDYTSPKPHVVEPPAAWTAARARTLAARPVLVFEFGGTLPRAAYFDARVPKATSPVASAANLSRSLLRSDGFADGRLLVHVLSDTEGKPGANLIVDPTGKMAGQIRAAWDDGAFAATSISADGTYAAGEQVMGDEDQVTGSKIFLVALNDAWRVGVSGVAWGADPRLSRAGSYLAFTDADGNAHTGVLQLQN